MELLNEEEFTTLIRTNYRSIYKSSGTLSREVADHCDFCKRDVYLKIHFQWYETKIYPEQYLPKFAILLVQCPSCERKSFLQTVIISTHEIINNQAKSTYEYFKLYQLPTQEYQYEISDIPDDQISLKQTIKEALYNLKNSQFISAAIMFRRGLQILTKDILGASGNNLYNQLEWLKTNSNKLGVNLTNMFHDNSELIRLVGNQGAHPDNDPTLHNFTKADANGLHDLFLIIINEVFVMPAKMKALQDELKARRKIQ